MVGVFFFPWLYLHYTKFENYSFIFFQGDERSQRVRPGAALRRRRPPQDAVRLGPQPRHGASFRHANVLAGQDDASQHDQVHQAAQGSHREHQEP